MYKKMAALGVILLLVSGFSFAEKSKTTYAHIYNGAFVDLDGVSTLKRTENEFGMEFNVRGLEPNHAYTVWVLAYNNPELCADKCNCSAGDFANPDMELGMFWATGRVSDSYGQAEFLTRLTYGALPEGEGQVLAPNGAQRDAQVLLMLRDHGPANEDMGQLDYQLSSHMGGCDVYGCNDFIFSGHSSPFCKN
ncbi:MAG: hypothetical protein ACI9Y1_003649 [Lentisphaeria bacterium]|jgi:hypothetical protein